MYTAQTTTVALHDGSEYHVVMRNFTKDHSDCAVSIDGKEVGVWRLAPGKSYTIERPVTVNKKFKFVKENTQVSLLD
jgi:hypothetical protein